MSYLPGLGKHAPARTIRLVCQVCDDTGWVNSAPVHDFDGFDGHSCYVGQFTPVPCFSCYPTNLKVIA